MLNYEGTPGGVTKDNEPSSPRSVPPSLADRGPLRKLEAALPRRRERLALGPDAKGGAPMGLFDRFFGDDAKIARHIRRLTNRDSQPEDRDSSAKWLAERGTAVRTRIPVPPMILLTGAQSRWLFIFIVVLLPLAVIGIGGLVWWRRR